MEAPKLPKSDRYADILHVSIILVVLFENKQPETSKEAAFSLTISFTAHFL